jgi:hypothetical protein
MATPAAKVRAFGFEMSNHEIVEAHALPLNAVFLAPSSYTRTVLRGGSTPAKAGPPQGSAMKKTSPEVSKLVNAGRHVFRPTEADRARGVPAEESSGF